MKYYILTESKDGNPGQMAEVTMEKPEYENFDKIGDGMWHFDSIAWDKAIDNWDSHVCNSPKHSHYLKNKVGEVVTENDFIFNWFVKTSSYQGDAVHRFNTEKDAENKYQEWSKWDGNLQAKTEKPIRVAVPVEEKKDEAVPDLTLATESQKTEIISGLTEIAAKEFLKAFYALGLKTHIETIVFNAPTGEYFRFSFTKINTKKGGGLPKLDEPLISEEDLKNWEQEEKKEETSN